MVSSGGVLAGSIHVCDFVSDLSPADRAVVVVEVLFRVDVWLCETFRCVFDLRAFSIVQRGGLSVSDIIRCLMDI